MSYLLKDIFSPDFLKSFSKEMKLVYTPFNQNGFITSVFDEGWQARELKQRMRHISTVLYNYLPAEFPEAAAIIEELIRHYQQKGIKEKVIEFCFLPDYVEQYGLEHFEASVHLVETLTTFTSCEFAVRPFIILYGDRMMQQMVEWSTHKNEKVRRLSSEGSRPRLPWAIALPHLKKNPEPLLPILENLKNDTSEYVRRSVANNLNDISKDNPAFALAIFNRWKGASTETDKLIKHAGRTLLKQGNAEALSCFGLEDCNTVQLLDFHLRTPRVVMGENLVFDFSLQNDCSEQKIIRLEYAVYFRKANGQLSKKVFKISEREYQPMETIRYERRQSFRPITTRKYYPGMHKISIIINGKEFDALEFLLTT